MFQKTVGTTSNNRNYNIATMQDGGLIATGYTTFPTSSVRDAFLIKFNKFGEVEWSKTYGGPDDETLWDVIISQNNDIVAAGHSASLGVNRVGLIGRCDSLGNPIWINAVGSIAGDINFYSVMETTTGHFVTAGLIRDVQNVANIITCKFDGQGSLLWSRIIGSQQNDEVMGMTETSTGDYLFAGLTNDINGFGGTDFAAVKIDPSGNILWKKLYGSSGNERMDDVIEIDGNYYFLGWSPAGGLGGNDVVVMKTDTAGDIIWVKGYGTPQTERTFNMIYNESEEEIIIAGYTDYSDTITNNRNTFLLSIDTAGAMNWAKSYGSNQTDGHWPTGLAINDDEGYYILASTQSFGPGDMSIYFIKTDKYGNTACYQKDPLFAQVPIIGWSASNFGTLLSDNIISDSVPIIGIPWTLQSSTQCCKLFIDPGIDKSVCPGNIAVIGTAGIIGYTYEWSYNNNPVATTPTLEVSHPDTGTYVLTVSAVNSNCDPVIDSVTVIPLPAPPIPAIMTTGQDNYLTTNITDSIQWFLNGMPIPSATSQTIYASQDGYYHVEATNSYGCITSSDTIYHTYIGVYTPKNTFNVTIYPVPADNVIAISFDETLMLNISVDIFDFSNRLIFSEEISGVSSGSTKLFDISNIKPGLYQIVITSQQKVYRQSVVIVR